MIALLISAVVLAVLFVHPREGDDGPRGGSSSWGSE